MNGYFSIRSLATCSQLLLDGLDPTFEIVSVTKVLTISFLHSGVSSFFSMHELVSGLQWRGISKLVMERFPEATDCVDSVETIEL